MLEHDELTKLIELLELCSKDGRPTWERVADAIAKSPEADEIQVWLGSIGDGSI